MIPQHDLKKRLLQSFVPLTALTEDHLTTLLRETQPEVVCRGQVICGRGDYDNAEVFLLSGSVAVDDGASEPLLIAAHDHCARFALAAHQPRLETVTAVEDCEVIRFDRDSLDSMLAWDQAAHYIMLDIAGRRDLDEDADWMLTLLRSNLFYKVPPMNIRQILSRFKPQFAHAGEVVIRQGELGECCYFIKEGLVAIHQAEDEKGKSELLAELGVGRCFGEDALVHDVPRNATVVMRENGVLMKLEKQDFFLLLKPPPVHCLSLTETDRELINGAVLVDVRCQDEYERAHATQALNMPLNILKLKSRLLDRERTYITYCNSGRRSCAAAYLLGEEGYRVTALRGGFDGLSMAQRLRFLAAGDTAHLHRERQLASVKSAASQ